MTDLKTGFTVAENFREKSIWPTKWIWPTTVEPLSDGKSHNLLDNTYTLRRTLKCDCAICYFKFAPSSLSKQSLNFWSARPRPRPPQTRTFVHMCSAFPRTLHRIYPLNPLFKSPRRILATEERASATRVWRLPPNILFLKHDSSIFIKYSNPVGGSRKTSLVKQCRS